MDQLTKAVEALRVSIAEVSGSLRYCRKKECRRSYGLISCWLARGYFQAASRPARAVMAGDVKVGTRIAAKPSELLEEGALISIKPTPKYVGRGCAEAGKRARLFQNRRARKNGAGYRRFHRRFYRLHVTTRRRESLCG